MAQNLHTSGVALQSDSSMNYPVSSSPPHFYGVQTVNISPNRPRPSYASNSSGTALMMKSPLTSREAEEEEQPLINMSDFLEQKRSDYIPPVELVARQNKYLVVSLFSQRLTSPRNPSKSPASSEPS